MANTDNPHGFNVYKHKYGTPMFQVANPYYVTTTESNNLFIGDPIEQLSTTNASALFRGVEGYAAGELMSVQLATEGGGEAGILGIMVYKRPLVNGLDKLYRVASAEEVIYVSDDPGVVYRAQEDSDAGASTITEMGLNFDYIITTVGDTTTGISGAELDSSSKNTTATIDFRVLGLSPKPHGNIIGTNAELLCMVNAASTAVPGLGI